MLDFGAGAGKGLSRGTTGDGGEPQPHGQVPQGRGEWHGQAAWAGGVCPQLGHREQPTKGLGGQIDVGHWGGKREGGPALCPVGSSAASSLGKGLHPRIPAKPLQPTPYFFPPAAAPRAAPSIYGANLGREHPPVGTGAPVGAPRPPRAADRAQEGPGQPAGCGARGAVRGWSGAASALSLHPPRPAPARCCPAAGSGPALPSGSRSRCSKKQFSKKMQVWLLDAEPRRDPSQAVSLPRAYRLPKAQLGRTIL